MHARLALASSTLSLALSIGMHGDAPGDPGRPAVLAVDVLPERIELADRFAYRQLLITGQLEDGGAVDLTREARLVSGGKQVQVSERGLARPIAEGAGELVFELDGRELRVPFEVSGLERPVEPSFTRDVMPVLSRIGCNAGGCHGSADGKNGFQLSLRGYDPAQDHLALTDDLAGRRFDRVMPERSLFLEKPCGGVPHEGGVLFEPGSLDYQLLRAWVARGAELDLGEQRVTSIEVLPADPVIPLPGMSQQVVVMASFPDGTRRDVTADAFLESDDIEVLGVQPGGLATGLRRGEAAVLARYEGQYAATRVLVMGDRAGFEWQSQPQHNWIDELVDAKLERVRALPSELCTDAEFLRRVSLDLTGLPPTVRETRIFLLDERPTRVKRDEAIERLIGSAAFVEHWTNKWSDLLQVNSKFLGEEGAKRFRDWVRAAVASNMAYDDFARALLDSDGSTYANPPTAYYKVLRQPDLVMENTTQLFLGVRFNCNKCHDHPFERWTKKQHWQLAGFFSQVSRANAAGAPLMPSAGGNQPEDQPVAFEELIGDKLEGEVVDPDLGVVVPPAFPFEHAGLVPTEAPRRERLAAWMTAPENPYFAKSYVNRLWSYFLGRGLIEPVDDLRAGNPPSNPALLERLTAEFVASGFDARATMRAICRSRTYQASIRTNEWNVEDRVHFSHAVARRLPAEVLFDALHQATGSRTRLPGTRAGTRATEVTDASVEALDGFLGLFGRPPRESACECERSSGMSLGQALSLVNGPTVADAVRDPDNALVELLAVENDARAIVEELYLAFLCRFPSATELDELAPSLAPERRANRAALAPEDEHAFATRLAGWEDAQPKIAWHPAEPRHVLSTGGAVFATQPDGSFLATGESKERDTLTIVVASELDALTGIRLEVLADERLPGNGPGRADNGNFVLGEITAVAIPLDDPRAAQPLAFAAATADFSQASFPVANLFDGKPETGWAIVPEIGRAHTAVLELATDSPRGKGTLLVLTLDQPYGGRHTLGRFRISVTDAPRPVRHHGLPDDVAAALATAPEARDAAQLEAIHAHFVRAHPELAHGIRLAATQDLAWALANSPAFLFNR